MYFNQKLKEYFKQKGLKNREIASKLGYSEAMIGRYLSKSKPNYEFILAIIDSYPDVNLNELFKEKDFNVVGEETASYSSNPKSIIAKIEQDLKRLKDSLDTI